MARTRRPAEGERAAISGYYPQYLLSSDLILRRLDEGRLEWVRLADPDAGRLDDFQIATPARIDAYQFKWSGQADTFKYTDLIRDNSNDTGLTRPSLIAQLADGWRRLRSAHQGRRVVVHLVTNDIPSPNTGQIPVGNPPPVRRTFAAFRAEGWTAARSGVAPVVWQPALEDLRRLTGMTPAEFSAFLLDCELEFGVLLPTSSSETLAATYRWQNLQFLLGFIQKTIQEGKLIELSSQQLLRSLGWEARYVSRFRHEFPDPTGPYLPIAITLGQLEDRITTLLGGYLAVVGPPGSGKSTLLTRALRRPRPERVVRYYAYVPDAQDPAVCRGESVNFLHDLCLALQQAGVSTEGTHLPGERELLLERFHRQLNLLRREYQDSNRKTIILIDGLDHIDRELHPERSLLADLPMPNQVPDGVFFILGTQTDQLADLSVRIQDALDQDDRRIFIGRLDRTATRQMAQTTGPPVELSSDQLDKVFELSDGHPLALQYLIQALSGAGDRGQVDAILASTEPYRGDIVAQYRTYWQAVQGNFALVQMLMAVARLRHGADLELLARWYGPEPIHRLVEVFRRYFVKERDGRWKFFHNSFRVFLCRETDRDISGEHSEQIDRQAHLNLADHFAAENADSPARSEELYHRVSAGDHAGVCRLATQNYFRNQIINLRPLDAVKTDIELAFPSAAAQNDIRAFAALTLIHAEVKQRTRLLGEMKLPSLLLDLGDVERAIEATRDGNRPRVGAIEAMELAVRFQEEGEVNEAHRIFELGEPLDMLAGQRRQQMPTDAWKILHAWARTAPRFRPLSEILEIVASIPVHEFRFGKTDEDAADRCRLLTIAGFTLVATSRWADLEQILARLASDTAGRHYRFWLMLRVASTCLDERGQQFLETLRTEFLPGELGPFQLLRLAEVTLERKGDDGQARKLIEGLPIQVPDLNRTGNSNDLFDPLLIHARLMYQFGDNRGAVEMIPDEAVDDRAGTIWFLRDVVVVARIWARARSGRALSAWDVPQEVMGIMNRFNRILPKGEDRHAWFQYRGARGWLYQHLVRAVVEHGRDALTALRNEFERRWQEDSLQIWPAALQREVLLEFAAVHEVNREWAVTHLHRIGQILPGGELYDLVREAEAQASGWITLREPDEARQMIRRVVRRANGIIGEDDQFDTWVDWLDRLATTDPQRALGQLDWFARAIVVLRETADGVASAAGRRLIPLAVKLDPSRAIVLARWLMNQEVLDHADRLKAILEGAIQLQSIPVRLAVYAFADLVIPFETVADEEVIGSILRSAHRKGGVRIAEWAAEYLAHRVTIYALPSTRSGWERGIRTAVTQLGLTPPASLSLPTSPQSTESDGYSSPVEYTPADRLVLDDESELSLEDVLRHERDVTALAALARRERYNSGFDWRPVIGYLCTLHSFDQMLPLVRDLCHKRGVRNDLITRSRAYREARDTAKAWGFARLALVAYDHFGSWSRRYREDSRLDATRVMIDTMPTEGRQQLWRLLVRDAGGDPRVLEEVISQLQGEVPVQDVWPEVEDFLHALFDDHLAGDGPLAPVSALSNSALGGALAGLLIEDIDHPVAPLSRSVRRACGLALMDREPNLVAAFRSLLAGQGVYCRAALEVIDAASRSDSTLIGGMLGELQALAVSPDSAVAMLAGDLCGRSDTAPTPVPARMSLPTDYRIVLPETALLGLERPDEPEPGQPWPDTDDPRQLLRIVEWLYAFLAKHTGLTEIVLLRRGVKLMEEVIPKEKWCAKGETELYHRLDRAGLRYTYRRPRADAAHRATFRLIGELWRAGQIPTEAVRIFVQDLRLCDPALILTEPAQRPPEVLTIPTGIWGDNQCVAWVDNAQSAIPLLLTHFGEGKLVLAEVSELEALARGLRCERRLSVLSNESVAQLNEEELIPPASQSCVAHYLAAAPPKRPWSLVLRNTIGASNENPAGQWVAFNPAIAQKLGWNLSSDGLFRWTDLHGKVMVESVWWLDGPIGLRGMLADNCVGEGWFVVAAPAALTALIDLMPGLHQIRAVTRSATLESGGERTRTVRHDETINEGRMRERAVRARSRANSG